MRAFPDLQTWEQRFLDRSSGLCQIPASRIGWNRGGFSYANHISFPIDGIRYVTKMARGG